jgi:DNA (cytosine-5)-methyltransferase 1
MKFKLGEFFCGPGGVAIGAELANTAIGDAVFEHAWAVDYHQDTCATYLQNVQGASADSVFCTDVRALELNKLSQIDGFAYGFPCNDFSLVGETKGLNGTFGQLYKSGLPVLKRFSPKFFIAENVGGIKSANEGNAFSQILKDLRTFCITPAKAWVV